MSPPLAGPRRAWIRAYRVLLLLYPPSFRRRHGEAMAEDVAELLSSRPPRSGPGLVRRVVVDLFRSVPREWQRALRARASPGAAARPAGALRRAVDGATLDLWGALRTLLRSPRFSLAVGALLALGLGLGTAVLSVVSAYLIRPLPYPHAERLVSVLPADVAVPSREAADLFELPVTWDLDVFTLLGEPAPELVYGAWVSPEYFEAFGMRTALGRPFTPDEAGPGGSTVAVIGHELWQRRWGGDPGVLGTQVRAFPSDRPDDAELFTVVGVLPPGVWHHHRYTELLAPLRADNPVYLGRLRPDLPREVVARALTERARSRMASVQEGFRVELVPLGERYAGSLRPVLAVALSAAVLVLLTACGNAAVLLLVRARRREREVAIRTALGAGRGRLARQLVWEGLLLAGGAAAAGVLLAAGTLDLAGGWVEAHLGRSVPGGPGALGVDRRALLATLAATLLTGTVFGLAPWAAVVRGGSSGGLRGRRARARHVLVAAEIAASLTLLVAGGLALRSALHVARLDLGFETDDLYTGSFLLRAASYPSARDRAAFHERVAEGVRAVPGVQAVGLGPPPFPLEPQPQSVATDGDGAASDGSARAAVLTVGSGWFDALGVPVLQGRVFEARDGPGAEAAVVVSEALALRLWPVGDPIGRRVQVGAGGEPAGPWHTVVGVVGDVRRSLDGDPAPELYRPLAEAAPVSATLVVRTRPGSPPPFEALRAALREVDPTVALYATTSLSERIAEARRPARFLAALLVGFSSLALLLAVAGLYAVLAFAAAARRREVAVRMALGARRGAVVGLLVAQGMAVTGAGIALGLLGAVALAGRLSGQLHGVGASDPRTYAAAAALLAAVAAVAAWLPARRASRTDPMEVLREE